MFWKFNYSPSHVDSLLEKPDVTLKELMDEENIVQECKSENKKLIDFLVDPGNFTTLVEMVIRIPEDGEDERAKYKYPNIACDLITSDVTAVTEALVSNDTLLTSIYEFIEREPPLNCLQASFFSKIMGLVIARKSEMMVKFIKSRREFVKHLVQHLGTSAIMDLLLRLITCVEPAECRADCIEWLNEQNLVKLLLDSIVRTEATEKHTNAAQSICDIIRLTREQSTIGIMIDGDLSAPQFSSALLKSIESKESISQLLDQMFEGEASESVIINGLYVIQTLLETRRFGSNDMGHDSSPRENSDGSDGSSARTCIIDALIPRLKDFHHLLDNPPKQHYTPMQTTNGCLKQPVGLTRLQVTRLISALVHTDNLPVAQRLAELGTIGSILDMFFQYSWNNFLHMQVEHCLVGIISSTLPNNPLQPQVFKEYHLLERISEAFESYKLQQTDPSLPRHGYYGHLTRLANHLVGSVDTPGENSTQPETPGSVALNKVVNELPEAVRSKWEACVTGALSDINKLNSVELVGSTCGGLSAQSSSDEDDDFRHIISYPQDDALQKAFCEYQSQQMTNNFVDQFGFNEDDFAEQEETIGIPFNGRVSSINFELTMVEDSPTSAALFEQACNDRIRQFDNADSDDELDITFNQSERRQSSNLAAAMRNKKGNGASGRRTSSQHSSEDDEDDDDDDDGDFGDDEGDEMAGRMKKLNLEQEEDEESDDSEEDLDSPRLIRQTDNAVEQRHAASPGTPAILDSNTRKALALDLSALEDEDDNIKVKSKRSSTTPPNSSRKEKNVTLNSNNSEATEEPCSVDQISINLLADKEVVLTEEDDREIHQNSEVTEPPATNNETKVIENSSEKLTEKGSVIENSADKSTDKEHETSNGTKLVSSEKKKTDSGSSVQENKKEEVKDGAGETGSEECGTSVDDTSNESPDPLVIKKLSDFTELRISAPITMMSNSIDQSGTVNHTEVV